MNFSMFSSSNFLSIKKPNPKLKESSRKKDRRRACGGEIKASKLGIKKPKRETISLVGFGCFIQPGESRIVSEFCFHMRWETGAGDESVVQALGNRCVESRTNLQRRSWTTTIFKALTIYTLRKSSRMFDKSCIALKTTRCFIKETMY